MSRICQLTGKKPITGFNKSHANNRTKRWFRPNLQTKKFYIPEEDRWVTIKLSTSALRTINKVGIYDYLKSAEKDGYTI